MKIPFSEKKKKAKSQELKKTDEHNIKKMTITIGGRKKNLILEPFPQSVI